MKHLYSPEELNFNKPGLKDKIRIFLAGPIQGSEDWRETLPELENVLYINPKRQDMDGFDWDEQVAWETLAFHCTNMVLFWIPKESEHVEGRDYAQTTRVELFECLARHRQVVVGIDPSINGRRYMVKRCEDYGVHVESSLEDTLKQLEKKLEYWTTAKTWFTSDTHFSSERALTLSRRPFLSVDDMDMSMVENWNKMVGPFDTVYHLGDFGNYKMLEYLSGTVHLVYGNYERTELDKSRLTGYDFLKDLKSKGFGGVHSRSTEVKVEGLDKPILVTHEPVKCKEGLTVREDEHCTLGLFGHIHGRQKIKPFGIDVGVDSNNYSPMSVSDVEFYFNAIEKGYYDQEVWVQ